MSEIGFLATLVGLRQRVSYINSPGYLWNGSNHRLDSANQISLYTSILQIELL